MSRVEELIAIGMEADFDLDDLNVVMDLNAPLGKRQESLVRLISGAWETGWDQCSEAYKTALANALPLPGRARVQ